MTTEDPLPEGVGRVPQWWMEITPINVLKFENLEEEFNNLMKSYNLNIKLN